MVNPIKKYTKNPGKLVTALATRCVYGGSRPQTDNKLSFEDETYI